MLVNWTMLEMKLAMFLPVCQNAPSGVVMMTCSDDICIYDAANLNLQSTQICYL